MTQVSSISQDELQQRRHSLRRQRRLKILQGLWRMMAMAGLTVGTFWLFTRPFWLIRSPEQVDVTGNQILSDETIRTLVNLDYPLSLLEIEPETLSQTLSATAPIITATTTRTLLPPRLNIQVQERHPVAVALPPEISHAQGSLQATYIQVGLLDAEGAWIPQISYGINEKMPLDLPTLKVRGIYNQYRQHWPQLYQAILKSPVQVTEVDWRDPSNLALKTDLGIVHLGPFTDRFPDQLATLDRMRNLNQQLDPNQVAYIDLTNPDLPSVQVLRANRPSDSPAKPSE